MLPTCCRLSDALHCWGGRGSRSFVGRRGLWQNEEVTAASRAQKKSLKKKKRDWSCWRQVWMLQQQIFCTLLSCSLLSLQQREQLVHHQSGRHPLWSHDFTESGSLTENNYICCTDGWEQGVTIYVRHSTFTMLFVTLISHKQVWHEHICRRVQKLFWYKWFMGGLSTILVGLFESIRGKKPKDSGNVPSVVPG